MQGASAIRFLWKLFDQRRYEHKLFFIKSKLIPSPEARLIRYRIEYIVVDIGNFLLYSNIKKPLGKSTKWNDKLSSCGSHHHLRTTLLSMPEAIRLKQQEGASDILESLSCYSIYYIYSSMPDMWKVLSDEGFVGCPKKDSIQPLNYLLHLFSSGSINGIDPFHYITYPTSQFCGRSNGIHTSTRCMDLKLDF